MKRIIFLLVCAIGMTGISKKAEAQSCVASSYYHLVSGAPKYVPTKADTVNGATGADTAVVQITCQREVTFQHSITKIGGRIDSATFKIWGSVDGTSYVVLNTQTSANASGALTYVVNAGVGNPYTYYMVTVACTNAATSSSLSWKGYLLVR